MAQPKVPPVPPATANPNPPQWQHRFAAELISPEQVANRSKWIETVVIPLLAMGISWAANPHDPLLRNASFPWLWFAPLLVALRYGVLPGLVSGILILIEWLLCDAVGLYGTTDFPREFFFGGALLILFGGEFSDVWRDRLNRVDETNLYLVERLSGLTRRHLLLNLSHDRLEQEMLARPGSLRDALVRLRAAVIEAEAPPGRTGGLPGTDGLLHMLAQYVNIEAAGLYTMTRSGTGFKPGQLVGELGEPLPLEASDELLHIAVETRNLAHIAGLDLSLERNSNQLIVAPLVASDNTIVGVLAVSKLPFFSLNVENLQMMSVILAYYADCINAAPVASSIGKRLPDINIPPMYAEELGRLIYMQRSFSISSHIVVLTFRGARGLEMPSELMRIKRGLDLYWETTVEGSPAIIVLMPFASVSAKEGFLERINGWLKTRFGASFDALNVDIRSINFASGDPLEALAGIVRK